MMLRFSVRTSFSCAPFPVRQNAVPPKLDLKCSYNSTGDYQTCLSLFSLTSLTPFSAAFYPQLFFSTIFQSKKSFVEFRCRRCRTHSSKRHRARECDRFCITRAWKVGPAVPLLLLPILHRCCRCLCRRCRCCWQALTRVQSTDTWISGKRKEKSLP